MKRVVDAESLAGGGLEAVATDSDSDNVLEVRDSAPVGSESEVG